MEKIIQFVMGFEKNGGFGFTREGPATLDDTYFALLILYEKKVPYENEKTFKFIRTFKKKNISVKHLFQIVHVCKLYKFPISWLDDSIQECISKKYKDSLSIYYGAKLAELTNNLNLRKKLKESINILKDENYVEELCRRAIALKKLGINFDEKEIADKIREFQGYDGGFSFLRKGAPSFIEETYLAIEALSELGEKPNDINKCIKFVKMCRANNGGYGRQRTTIPNLESTYYAIKILKLLGA